MLQFADECAVCKMFCAASFYPFFDSLSTRLSTRLSSVKLTPAVWIDRVGHDLARCRRHELNAGRTFLIAFWHFLIFGCFVS